MEDEKNDSVTNFLNEVSQDVFSEKSSDEEATEEVAGDEGPDKPLPFHKDPKVQRYVEKQIDKALKDRPSAEQTFKQEVHEINLPTSFVELVGNDTPEKVKVLKDLSDYFSTLKGEARSEFLKEMEEREERQKEEDTKAQEELDNYFEEIEENYNVDLSSNSASAKKMRSEFIEFVRKIAPKNSEGEVAAFPDLVASFEAFQERGKPANPTASRAKELASRGMTRSGDAETAVPQGRSWKDVDRFFDKLKASN